MGKIKTFKVSLIAKTKGKWILRIFLNKDLREYLQRSLREEGDIVESDRWVNSKGIKQKFYRGGFDLVGLNNDISNNKEVLDSFGARNIKGNIAVLRSKELLDTGNTSFLFEDYLFYEVKSLTKGIADFLIAVSKHLRKGVVEITGYEIKKEYKIKESEYEEED